MGKLKPISSKQVLKKLKRAGFIEIHQRGSHLTLKNEQRNKFVTVPVHNRDIPIGTLYNIIVRQAELSIEEFNYL